MPLYEYQCESCGQRFERIQKFSDPPVSECPSCHGPVQKLISSPAIQFKGSGWYITDYAKSGKTADSAASSTGSSTPAAESSSSGSGADKPAASTSETTAKPAATPTVK